MNNATVHSTIGTLAEEGDQLDAIIADTLADEMGRDSGHVMVGKCMIDSSHSGQETLNTAGAG